MRKKIFFANFTWVRDFGQTTDAATPPASYLGPRLSPNGQKLAVAVRRVAPRGVDVWVYNVLRGAPTRLTFSGTNSQPVSSPDRKRLV
jgi:Tol biopolymer transport system component